MIRAAWCTYPYPASWGLVSLCCELIVWESMALEVQFKLASRADDRVILRLAKCVIRNVCSTSLAGTLGSCLIRKTHTLNRFRSWRFSERSWQCLFKRYGRRTRSINKDSGITILAAGKLSFATFRAPRGPRLRLTNWLSRRMAQILRIRSTSMCDFTRHRARAARRCGGWIRLKVGRGGKGVGAGFITVRELGRAIG